MDKVEKYSEDIMLLAKYAKVLSHPARIFIIKELLKINSCCYSSNIVEKIPIQRSTLSQHLKELKYVGLIKGEVEPPFIKYCLDKENWEKCKNIINQFINE